jgi:hypothetical protein
MRWIGLIAASGSSCSPSKHRGISLAISPFTGDPSSQPRFQALPSPFPTPYPWPSPGARHAVRSAPALPWKPRGKAYPAPSRAKASYPRERGSTSASGAPWPLSRKHPDRRWPISASRRPLKLHWKRDSVSSCAPGSLSPMRFQASRRRASISATAPSCSSACASRLIPSQPAPGWNSPARGEGQGRAKSPRRGAVPMILRTLRERDDAPIGFRSRRIPRPLYYDRSPWPF